MVMLRAKVCARQLECVSFGRSPKVDTLLNIGSCALPLIHYCFVLSMQRFRLAGSWLR